MGEVYRARDPKLDRDVAVKVLPERFAQDAEARSRFEREAKIVGSSTSPPNEVLAYVPGGGIRGKRDLDLVDGTGSASPISRGRPYNLAKLSPDGRRVVTELTGANNDIWTYDLASGALSRLTL